MHNLEVQVTQFGFAIVHGILSKQQIERLLAILAQVELESGKSKRGGIRNVLHRFREIGLLAESAAIRRLVDPIIGRAAVVISATLFDKTPEANWKVPWHQDLTIAVQDRIEFPDFGPWSLKDDVHHVQPPIAVMESILAVRIHLDDCTEENGALRVLPGTHRLGRLTDRQIREIEKSGLPCAVGPGGALLMRPLLLHASSSAESPSHRRVLHFEYTAYKLPAGLRWFAGKLDQRYNPTLCS